MPMSDLTSAGFRPNRRIPFGSALVSDDLLVQLSRSARSAGKTAAISRANYKAPHRAVKVKEGPSRSGHSPSPVARLSYHTPGTSL